MMNKRKGSRKGSEYDLIDNIISVAEREYGDLEDLTQTQADKVCETVAGITGESVENVKAQLREMDELNGVTRQGSRKGQDFTAQGINNVANAFKDITTKKIPNAIGKLKEDRDGSRKGGTVTFKDVIDYFENLQETSPKDDDELWDEALNKFGVTTDLGKFDSSEFATYYYGSGTKSTNPIPDDMMVSGRNGSRKGSSLITSENQFIDYFESLGYDPDDVRNNVLQEFRYEIHSGGVSVEEIDDYLSYASSDILRKGSRKGSRLFCDLSSVSGKGSRPENLGSIASKIVSGRNRSINMDGEYEDESRVGSRLGAQKNDYISWFKEYRRYDTDDQQELEELVEDDFELMVRAANQHGLSLYEAALFQSYLEENNGYDNSLKFAKQYASGDTSIPSPWEDKPLWDRFPDARKGSRRGDALAQQIIGDNVEEDSDGYNFYDARNALRLEGYSEDEIEDNIDTWMYQHMN